MNKYSTEYLESIAPDIGKASEILSRQFPTIEYDDIYQDLWVYVLERKSPLKTRDEYGTPVNFLVQAGQRICGKEIATLTPRDDAYWYTPSVVRKMLDAGMLYFTDSGEPAGRSDLTVAFMALASTDKRHVVAAFRDDDPDYRASGGRSGRLSEAVRKLTDEMNRVSEQRSDWHIEREIAGYTGSRKHAKTWNEG